MNRKGVLARTLLAAGLVIALGTSAGALAQEPDTAANTPAAAEQSAAASDQPRRGRERRRNAEAEVAAAAPAATAAVTGQAETVEMKVVCKTIKPLGSRVGRRICGTEEQWAAINQSTNEDAQEGMRQVRSRSGVTGTPSSAPASTGPGGQ